MIQRTSGSGLIRISILDHSRFTFQPWQSFCSLNAFVLIMHICDCVDFCQYGTFWDDDDHHHHDYYYYHYLSEWPTYCRSIFIELLCYISVIFSLSSRISEVAADFMKKWYYSALSSLPLPSRTNIAHVMRTFRCPGSCKKTSATWAFIRWYRRELMFASVHYSCTFRWQRHGCI